MRLVMPYYNQLVLPAYAGMILRKCGSREKTTSAPRVCGDDPRYTKEESDSRYVLPAYAGMIRPGTTQNPHLDGAPRVCGDDPKSLSTRIAWHPCSPRMRG